MTASSDDELWAAVADPSRRRVLDLLVQRGESTASAIAVDVPFTRQAVMKHLAVLAGARLVTSERVGREVRYSVVADRLDDAARAMADVAASWDRRLGAIKRIAEKAHASAQRTRRSTTTTR